MSQLHFQNEGHYFILIGLLYEISGPNEDSPGHKIYLHFANTESWGTLVNQRIWELHEKQTTIYSSSIILQMKYALLYF